MKDVKDAVKINHNRAEEAKEVKETTKSLYQMAFAEDTEAFIDYYYNEKCSTNEIYTITENSDVVSMLHLNPFSVQIKVGNTRIERTIYYLVAVATHKEKRKQGFMRKLLIGAMKDLYEEKSPFLFLMPANPEIYQPFQFRYFYKKKEVTFRRPINHLIQEGYLEEIVDGNNSALAEQLNEFLNHQYQISIYRDIEYMKRLLKELKAQNGCCYLEREGDKVKSFLTDRKSVV